MEHYEIEIKSLLEGKEHAERIAQRMQELDPDFCHDGSHRQLNHYFINGNLIGLVEALRPYVHVEKQAYLEKIASKAKAYSLRSREIRTAGGAKVIFVLKASVDDGTSFNGSARLEFETEVEMPLEELDRKILEAGFVYQAKWSRERSEYRYRGLNVSIDRNAGYGYLAEFEKIIEDDAGAEAAKSLIRREMADLGVEELPQERLERMFKHYNDNWDKYYGTEKTFIVE
ncbi:MAG: CYTH domain-containing protein [Candidatus Saccharibacteria bacterium]